MVFSGKISIIMPCYNAEAHLAKSIESALTQTYENLELIVINDGSTDRSLEILQEIDDPRLRIISQPNRGVSSARNRGLGEARGDYIAFLDADDAWHPQFLESGSGCAGNRWYAHIVHGCNAGGASLKMCYAISRTKVV